MSYVYESPTHQRLVLGTSAAPCRVCLPIGSDLYAGLRMLTPAQQARLLALLPMVLREAVGAIQDPLPTPVVREDHGNG